jgi:SAM-dependent methyltransferase
MIPVPELLGDTLRDEVRPHLADERIWSVLPEDVGEAELDSIASSYDRLARTRLYSKLAWGLDPADYAAYAREALEATDEGGLLDVACGSLTFTEDVYARASRPVVLLDRSLEMLRIGRERLAKRRGNSELVLLHADGLDLPFRDAAFTTVACHGALHVVGEVSVPLRDSCAAVAQQAPDHPIANGEPWVTLLVFRRPAARFFFRNRAGE